MGLSYDRIKSSFVQQLESLGLVSLDQGRHVQLSQAVDSLTESLRKFLIEEEPEVVVAKPKADPKANAEDVPEWLTAVDLPTGWSFRRIPTTAHGAGQSVFAHYDIKNGDASLVAGLAHVHLIAPDGGIVDVIFSPGDGQEKFNEVIAFEISDYRKPDPIADGSGTGRYGGQHENWTFAGDGTDYPAGGASFGVQQNASGVYAPGVSSNGQPLKPFEPYKDGSTTNLQIGDSVQVLFDGEPTPAEHKIVAVGEDRVSLDNGTTFLRDHVVKVEPVSNTGSPAQLDLNRDASNQAAISSGVGHAENGEPNAAGQ